MMRLQDLCIYATVEGNELGEGHKESTTSSCKTRATKTLEASNHGRFKLRPYPASPRPRKMFDTAIIYKTFTRNTVNIVISRLKILGCKQHQVNSGRVSIFQAKYALHRYGVKYIAMINQPNDTYVNVYISFSLQGLYNADAEHLFIPSASNNIQLKNNFSCLMEELNVIRGTGIASWKVRRLDFAVDIETPYVDLYVKLMKKAKQPFHYKLLCDKAGSFYAGTQKRTTVFNHYNKTDERRGREAQEDQEESLPVLRLEVQVKNARKLKSIADKHDLKNKSLFDFLKMDIARNVIERHDERFGLTGDYFSMAEAVRLINASDKHKSTKERMISFINKISKCNNVNDACRLYEAATGKSGTVIIRTLKELGINPVAIPFRENIKSLPAIVRLVEEAFDKLEAKNQVLRDENGIFQRNENNVGTLPKAQLFTSNGIIYAGFKAFSIDNEVIFPLRMCIFKKMVGKNKNIGNKNGRHTECDWLYMPKQSHYRGPP